MCFSVETLDLFKRFWPQSFAVNSLNLGQLGIGLGLGFSSILIPQLQDEDSTLDVNSAQISWIASVISLGQMAGALLGAVISAKAGRKKAILLSAIPSIVGWILIAIAQNFGMLVAGRSLCGLGMGMEGTVHPVYVCELTSPDLRGPLASSGIIVITTGILFIYAVGTFVQWKIAAWICSVVPFIMCVCVFFIPESPAWLVHKGQYNLADKALAWLKREEAEFAKEVENDINAKIAKATAEMNGGVDQNANKFTIFISKTRLIFGRFFSKRVVIPYFIVVGLFIIQNWSGFIVTIFYTVTIFQDAEVAIDAFYATMILGGVQVFGSTLGTIVVNLAGRRLLLILSTAICALCMGIMGTVFFLKMNEPESVIIQNFGKWLPLGCLLLFTFFFTMGLGPVPWVLLGELFPADVRSIAAGLATCSCFAAITTASLSYNWLVAGLGLYGTYWLYSFVCGVGLLFVLFMVPETKNRTLEEIEAHFTESAGAMALFTSVPPKQAPMEKEGFDNVPEAEAHI